MMFQSADNFAPVIVMPTYNNAATLAGVLSGAAASGISIIVVNDGCTDSTAQVVDAWRGAHPAASVTVLTHRLNRGKAAALHSGFAAAREAGFTHALSIDTDGQHDPGQIPQMLAAARAFPWAYVLGHRDDTRPDYPVRSRIGRRISNFLIRLESGQRVRDSQCGMRVYPLRLIRTVRCRAGHFGFEAEIITRAAWSGCPIVEVPIVTRYLPIGQRVSHFRPWLDTVRGIGMHVRLLGRALVPWPHPIYREMSDAASSPQRSSVLQALWRWINPMRAWRELKEGQISRSELSAALAVGVFIGNLPAYGGQTVLGLYAARRLHLQPVAVIAGSHVSIPPVAPFLIAAAIGMGHLLLHGAWPSLDLLHAPWSRLAGSVLLDWAVGGVVLGFVLALATFTLSQLAFACADRLKRSRRTSARRELRAPASPGHTQAGPSTHPAAPVPVPAPAAPG
jgi:uncharacterized protein (DUF2062 family)